MEHIGSLTEQWRKMFSLLGNKEILFKLYTDVRANKLTSYFTAVNA